MSGIHRNSRAKNPTNSTDNTQEPQTGSSGTLIAVEHDQKMVNVPTSRRCMMCRNSALLSIGAALLFSLFVVNGGYAFQLDRDQNATIKHVSNTPIPCAGRTAATCRTQSRPGSGAKATDGLRYTSQVANTANPCGGRTGAACTTQSQPGSGAPATDGSQYTISTSASAAGMLFSVVLIALIGLGTSKLRHNNGHHA